MASVYLYQYYSSNEPYGLMQCQISPYFPTKNILKEILINVLPYKRLNFDWNMPKISPK